MEFFDVTAVRRNAASVPDRSFRQAVLAVLRQHGAGTHYTLVDFAKSLPQSASKDELPVSGGIIGEVASSRLRKRPISGHLRAFLL